MQVRRPSRRAVKRTAVAVIIGGIAYRVVTVYRGAFVKDEATPQTDRRARAARLLGRVATRDTVDHDETGTNDHRGHNA